MKKLLSLAFILIFVLVMALFTGCREGDDKYKNYEDEDGWTPPYSTVAPTEIRI